MRSSGGQKTGLQVGVSEGGLQLLLLYAAFNAPCVGHKDDESQAILVFDNPTLIQTASLTANLNQWVETARVIFVFFLFFFMRGGANVESRSAPPPAAAAAAWRAGACTSTSESW